jgi:hypothetical protein
MLKRLARKLAILSVVVVALTTVSTARTQAEPECYFCYCENGRCTCVRVACP